MAAANICGALSRVVGACALGMLLVLGGCTAPPAADGTPRIRIAVNAVEGGKQAAGLAWLQAVAPDIEASMRQEGHPVEIRIVQDGGSDESYKAKMVLDLYGGTGPDIYGFDGFWTAEMASAGLLQPLDPYLAGWNDWSQYLPSMQGMGAYQGHTYLVPFLTDVRGIYYRKDLFRQAGLPETWTPTRWADIFKAGEALQALPGVTPIQWDAGTSYGEATTMQGFFPVLLAAGGSLYDFKTGRWNAGDAALRRAVGFFRTLYVEKKLASVPLQLDPKGRERSFEMFRDGKIGIYPEGTYMWQGVVVPGGAWGIPNRDEVVGWAPMPGGGEPGDPPQVSISGGGGFIVNKNSPHADLAWKVLAGMASAASMRRHLEMDPIIPPRRDLLESAEFRKDAELSREVAEALPVTTFRPGFPVYPRVSDLVQQMVEKVIQGVPVDQALEAYARDLAVLVGPDRVAGR